MTKIEALMREVEGVPPEILDEILDFARFLKSKSSRDRLETAILSESVLSEDWLTPEEDQAWKHL
jgi:hypothetical protein